MTYDAGRRDFLKGGLATAMVVATPNIVHALTPQNVSAEYIGLVQKIEECNNQYKGTKALCTHTDPLYSRDLKSQASYDPAKKTLTLKTKVMEYQGIPRSEELIDTDGDGIPDLYVVEGGLGKVVKRIGKDFIPTHDIQSLRRIFEERLKEITSYNIEQMVKFGVIPNLMPKPK